MPCLFSCEISVFVLLLCLQGRSPAFEVRGPSLRCELALPGVTVQSDAFLVPASVSHLSPPRLHVAFVASFAHNSADWIGVARVGGPPNSGETSKYVVIHVGVSAVINWECLHCRLHCSSHVTCFLTSVPLYRYACLPGWFRLRMAASNLIRHSLH